MTDEEELAAQEPRRPEFEHAWSHFDEAVLARAEVAELWSELCDYEPFDTNVTFDDAGHGRIEVVVSAPPRLLAALSDAAANFVSEIKASFDSSVQAAADLISGVVSRPDEKCHLMPLCRTKVDFVELVSGGGLDGLRGDQVQLIEQFQPFAVGPPGTDDVVGPTMLHLAEMVNPQRDPARPRLAIWAHSSQPEIVVGSAGHALESVVADDGPLLDRRTIATFMCEKVDRPKLSANPNVEFDPIFYDEPLPADPDDNLNMRSWALRVLAREFIVAMQRSVNPAQFRPSLAEQMAARIRAPAPSLWGEVEFDSVNRPGFVGGSIPWKRGWSHAEGEVAGEADHASLHRSGEGPGGSSGAPGP